MLFEIYEAAYRFTSAAAAKAYTSVLRQNFGKYKLPSRALPAGFTAGTELLGNKRRTSERQIAVIGQLANVTITVWLQGGELLSWRDSARYWDGAWARLRRLQA